ncbi:MAG TPA: HAMP domain-containing sensor histidine kinase [Anaerolineales bacterium]|nr:HAMP domain-containing sensor histidine kinase [Anaerolineales bacterium]
MPRFLAMRLLGVLLFLLVLGGTACVGTLWLLGLVGPSPAATSGFPWWLAALAILLLFGVLSALRRLALPLGDLIDAAERVEAGDLSWRVAVRGPRELRSLARAFNAMLDRLRHTEDQRRRLLADVTHELRTPVAVIQGNLEALLDGVYPADADHLRPVLEESQVLSRLIDDLRTLSLAESGALQLHREPTDLGVLIGEVAASFRAQAESLGIRLETDVDDNLPLAEIDPLRVREVLVNLTGNALRHTPRGGEVRIRATANPVGAGVVLEVRDSGTGIDPRDLPHIFDRFYKSADSPGSGLGLAIAKNLVVAHGGEIRAESRPGAGTTVVFNLPGNARAGWSAGDEGRLPLADGEKR